MIDTDDADQKYKITVKVNNCSITECKCKKVNILIQVKSNNG